MTDDGVRERARADRAYLLKGVVIVGSSADYAVRNGTLT